MPNLCGHIVELLPTTPQAQHRAPDNRVTKIHKCMTSKHTTNVFCPTLIMCWWQPKFHNSQYKRSGLSCSGQPVYSTNSPPHSLKGDLNGFFFFLYIWAKKIHIVHQLSFNLAQWVKHDPVLTGRWCHCKLTCPPSPPVSAVMSLKCVIAFSWLDMDIMLLFLEFFWCLGMLRRTIIDSS